MEGHRAERAGLDPRGLAGREEQGFRAEAGSVIDVQESPPRPQSDPVEELRRRGTELLTRSADVRSPRSTSAPAGRS